MPIPESVKVTFKGEMQEYMDFRDVVHATQNQNQDIKKGNRQHQQHKKNSTFAIIMQLR